MTVLNNAWGVNPVVVAPPTGAEIATSTTLQAFQGWSITAQVAFIKANGVGNPPQVILGPAGHQGLATLTGAGEVASEALPTAFTQPPSGIDYATFASWSQDVQVAYMQANIDSVDTGHSPATLACGTGSSQFKVNRYVAFGQYDRSQPTTIALPAVEVVPPSTPPTTTYSSMMSVSDFCNLSETDQRDIASLHSPVLLAGATGASTDIAVTITFPDSHSLSIKVPADTFPGYSDALTSTGTANALVSDVDPASFRTWPQEIQTSYLKYMADTYRLPNGTGNSIASLVFGVTSTSGSVTDGATATLQTLPNNGGFEVTMTANPAGFGAYLISTTSKPSAETFLSWPASAQLAYASAQPSYPVTLAAAGGGTLKVDHGHSSTDGLQLSFSLPTTADQATLDPDLFAFASSSQQRDYFVSNHADPLGTFPWLVVGTAGHETLITGASDGSNLTAYAIPPGYHTSPTALDSTTFLSWPAAVRAKYLVDFGVGANWAVTFKDGQTCGIDASNQSGYILPDLIDFTPTGYTAAQLPYKNLSSGSIDATLANTLYPDDLTVPSTTSYTTLDPATFQGWTSQQQYAYLKDQISKSTANPKPAYLTIGGSNTNVTPIDVFYSATSIASVPKIYIVQNLLKTDIAGMSYADQKTLASNPAFLASAKGLGLIPDGIASSGSSPTDAANAASAATLVAQLVDSYRKTVVTDPNVPSAAKAVFAAEIDLIGATLFGTAAPVVNDAYVSNVGSDYTTLKANPNATDTHFPALPPTAQTSGSAIFSLTDIKNKLDAIQKRFTRLSDFAGIATRGGTNDESALTIRDANGHSYSFETNNVAALLGQVDNAPWCDGNGVITSYNTPVYITQDIALPNADVNAIFSAIVRSSLVNGQTLGSPTPPLTLLKTTVETTNNYTTTLGLSFVNISQSYSSADNDASQRSGYSKFLQQETVILNNAASAHQLAISGSTAGTGTTLGLSGTRNLDLPTLLCLYQIYNSNIEQAIVSADSEEVNQVNAVLQEYAAMQSIINATAATAGNDANASVQMQVGNTNPAVVWLFNNYSGDGTNTDHVGTMSAVEKLYFSSGFTRPQTSLHLADSGASGAASYNQNAKPSYFTDFGTRLSDAITQLNQQSQIKMNDITSETKQQDRFFDLASTSLTKLNEALSQIASAN